MKTIHVSASREYDVCIGRGLIRELGARAAEVLRGRSAVVVSDTNVAPLYLEAALESLRAAGFAADSFVFPAGEASKNGETYLSLLNFLAEKPSCRRAVGLLT